MRPDATELEIPDPLTHPNRYYQYVEVSGVSLDPQLLGEVSVLQGAVPGYRLVNLIKHTIGYRKPDGSVHTITGWRDMHEHPHEYHRRK